MTLALKDTNGNLFWFDAVMHFDDSYTASVSKHAIESGATITDHTVIHNNGIQFTGVISDVDFNSNVPVLNKSGDTLAGQNYTFDTINFVDTNSLLGEVQISSNQANPLTPLIPASLSNIFGNNPIPSVSLPLNDSPVVLEEVKTKLITLQQGAINPNTGLPTGTSIVDVLMFDGDKISRLYSNCIITHLAFNETPENDGCLYVQASLEQVRFVSLETAQVGKLTWTTITTKATKTKKKGVQGASGGAGGGGTTDSGQKDATSSFMTCMAQTSNNLAICVSQYLGADVSDAIQNG